MIQQNDSSFAISSLVQNPEAEPDIETMNAIRNATQARRMRRRTMRNGE